MKNNLTGLISILFTVIFFSTVVFSQTTEFTYQGRLLNSSVPATGNYDFEFALYDAVSGGVQIGSTLTRSTVAVANGDFSVKLDFGSNFPGANRFLEIRVRQTGGGAFTPLAPRQAVNSSPYSVQSLNATTATNAASADNLSGACVGCVTNNHINSVDGGKVTGTVANATNAVNATTATSATTAATAINATNAVNATNAANAVNATNATNAVNFSGPLAGDVTGNQTATTVEKLRAVPLPAQVVADNGKVLKYKNNGFDPITYEWATDNTGGGSGVTSVTASGPLASSGGTSPNISLTGIIQPANGGTGVSTAGAAGSLLRSNGTAWTSSALQAADVPDLGASYVKNTTTLQASSNFNISGTGTANIFNATTQYNIGVSRVLSVLGTENVFTGVNAGIVNTGGGNSFFGNVAGQGNTTGGDNSFFGDRAGIGNTIGSTNSFFGELAGQSNTTGSQNTMIGFLANVGSGNLTNATAIGFGTTVTQSNSLVLGSGANVGIGTSAPGFPLNVVGSAGSAGSAGVAEFASATNDTGVRIKNTATNGRAWTLFSSGGGSGLCQGCFTIYDATSGQSKLAIDTSGIVSISALGAAGATALCRNGSGQISTCSSSARYKNNINPFRSGLDLIRKLRPVSFNWKDGGMLDMGLVAEEVNAVEPLLTTTNASGQVEGVKYDRVGVVLVNAVQEQQRQIDAQKVEIDALKAAICKLDPQASFCRSKEK